MAKKKKLAEQPQTGAALIQHFVSDAKPTAGVPPKADSARVLVCFSGSIIPVTVTRGKHAPVKVEIRFNKRIANDLYVSLQPVADDVAQWLADQLSLNVRWMPREEYLNAKRNAHPIRTYEHPLKRKRKNWFRSLVKALEGHFDKPFGDWAAEQTNFPSRIAEAALAHVVGDKTEAAYQRGDLLEKRRLLMEAWAEYCTRAKSAKVVQLRQRKAA